MSMARLVLQKLAWSELAEILSYLTIHEVYMLGCTCKSAFVTYLREKSLREGLRTRGLLAPSHARFLSKLSQHEKVLLVSYPRSGNSFVRKLLELETKTITGSDSRPNRTLSASLLKFGYYGEAITDQSVWIVKSHFPERLGYIRFPVQRVILLVRNPFDAIESYFHMGMTNTHNKTLSAEAFAQLKEVWDEFVVNEAKVWTEFHQYWTDKMQTIPTLIVRYEDLLRDEKREAERMITFLRQGKAPISNKKHPLKRLKATTEHNETIVTATSPNIPPLTNSTMDSKPGYAPRNKSVGKAIAKMSDEQIDIIIEKSQRFLDEYGYCVCEDGDSVSISTRTADTEEIKRQNRVLIVQEKEIITPTITIDQTNNNNPAMLINESYSVRTIDDKFGRKITDLRRKYTENDKKPLPVS